MVPAKKLIAFCLLGGLVGSYLNLIRVTGSGGARGIYVWSPDSTVHEPDRFGRIVLEPGAAKR